MKSLVENTRDWWDHSTPRQRSILLGSIAAIALALVWLLFLLTRGGSYSVRPPNDAELFLNESIRVIRENPAFQYVQPAINEEGDGIIVTGIVQRADHRSQLEQVLSEVEPQVPIAWELEIGSP